ncbi:hypothetical protein ACFU7T_13265 [Streptomyces sp. NPDC057555]|uniref:hypothetical protein n=1 Tax=Streptomyces sp. NPDC057555 TaxID=3346166 RepID=UPI0036AACF0D
MRCGGEGEPECGLLAAVLVQWEELGQEFFCSGPTVGVAVGGQEPLGVGAVFGTALGALRDATVALVDKGGVLWQRYTARTFLTLIGTLAVTAGFNVLAVKAGMHQNARPIQLSIGVSFLGESLMVGRRGMASGIPFAPARTR